MNAFFNPIIMGCHYPKYMQSRICIQIPGPEQGISKEGRGVYIKKVIHIQLNSYNSNKTWTLLVIICFQGGGVHLKILGTPLATGVIPCSNIRNNKHGLILVTF